MIEGTRKYFSDIIIAIDLIDNFTQDTNDFKTYEKDYKTQSAVERQLAIVGEALNQLRRMDAELLPAHGYQIIALRNRLIHAYDGIDNSIV